jgi:hypothetical protein
MKALRLSQSGLLAAPWRHFDDAARANHDRRIGMHGYVLPDIWRGSNHRAQATAQDWPPWEG